MIIEAIINRPSSKWLESSGPFSDIVISSRVRLARNLLDVPFPQQMSEKQAQDVVDGVAEILAEKEVRQVLGNLEVVALSELSALDRQILVEKHLISPIHADNTARGRGLAIRDDEAISIMLNEEDHLRIQCLFSGLQVKEAWELANQVDNHLESKLSFAFDERWGYLTVCPTNVGTGMRASVMLHLPALMITNQAQRVLSTLSQIGLAVRGLYGEGTEATGNLFQISNQVTLGLREEELVNNLTAVTGHIIEQERSARQHLLQKARWQLEDRVCRAQGALAYARIMTSEEALSHLSDVRLGVDLGIIKSIDLRTLNELIIMTQPGYLQKLAGQEMSGAARDLKRASIIREKLKA
ncbi:MAG: protein arginine kinase [Syntrophomonadaceae bacterium]|nr:protein arginine kinase [Syntrophomonadaceae bacterium]